MIKFSIHQILHSLSRKFSPAEQDFETVTISDGRLTPDHIAWGYRLFLDREPESENAIIEKLKAWTTTKDLRVDFMSAPEFRQKNPDLAYTNESNVVIKEVNGEFRLFIDLSDYVVGLGIIRGQYEPAEMEFVRRIVKPGQTVLDIGANIGLFTMLMASLVGDGGRVYAFEPLERNTKLIKQSLIENHFQNRVILEEAAVGREEGIIQMTWAPEAINYGGAYIYSGEDALPGHALESVKLVALDSYPLRRPIDFVKIDIEGAEPLALRGAAEILRADHPTIISELHPEQLHKVGGYSPAGFVSELESYGYNCYILHGNELETYTKSDLASIQTIVFLPTTT